MKEYSSIFKQDELDLIQNRLDSFYSMFRNLNSFTYPAENFTHAHVEIPEIPIQLIEKYHKYLASLETIKSSTPTTNQTYSSLKTCRDDDNNVILTPGNQVFNNKFIVEKIVNNLIQNSDKVNQQNEKDGSLDIVLLGNQDLNDLLSLSLLSRNCFKWCKAIVNNPIGKVIKYTDKLTVPYGTEFSLFKQPSQAMNYLEIKKVPFNLLKQRFEAIRHLVIVSEDNEIGAIDSDEWTTLIYKPTYVLYPPSIPQLEHLEVYSYYSHISSYQRLVQLIVSNGNDTRIFGDFDELDDVEPPKPKQESILNTIKYFLINIGNEEDTNDISFDRYLFDCLLAYHPDSLKTITIDMNKHCQAYQSVMNLYFHLKNSHPSIRLNIHSAKYQDPEFIIKFLPIQTNNNNNNSNESITEFLNILKPSLAKSKNNFYS